MAGQAPLAASRRRWAACEEGKGDKPDVYCDVLGGFWTPQADKAVRSIAVGACIGVGGWLVVFMAQGKLKADQGEHQGSERACSL